MSQMGSIPRSTSVLEISTTNHYNSLASTACSSWTSATRTRSSTSSIDRSCPLKECRMCAYSSASFASRTSKSISCRERRIWHSSNIHLKLMECLEPDEKACVLARYSCWIASICTCSASCSTHALPRARSQATRTSSDAMRGYSCSSSSTDDVATAPGGGKNLHPPSNDD
jgi:hypothetical protein